MAGAQEQVVQQRWLSVPKKWLCLLWRASERRNCVESGNVAFTNNRLRRRLFVAKCASLRIWSSLEYVELTAIVRGAEVGCHTVSSEWSSSDKDGHAPSGPTDPVRPEVPRLRRVR